MKNLMLVIAVAAIAGCASQPRTFLADNPEGGVSGAKPEGYPKTEIRALPDQPGFCVSVTENWREGEREGKTVWLKEKTVSSVSCTKTRWHRLAQKY